MRSLSLAIAYYLALTPYGLIRRFVRDPLARRWEPAADSYLVRTGRAA